MSEFRIVQDKFEWKKILEDNDFRDIYYQYEYAYSLFLHGDGEPLLIYYKGLETELFYVVMQHDIADDDHFKDLIMKGRYYDWETPYGYGGPVIKGNFTLEDSQSFCRQLKEYCCDKKIVSQFVRFYPLLHNWEQKDLFDEIREIKRTVFIDTSTAEKIFENMDSKNRNMVRKAKRNNIIIEYDNGERLDEFIRIYTLTMNRHSADSYYIFSPNTITDI